MHPKVRRAVIHTHLEQVHDVAFVGRAAAIPAPVLAPFLYKFAFALFAREVVERLLCRNRRYYSHERVKSGFTRVQVFGRLMDFADFLPESPLTILEC